MADAGLRRPRICTADFSDTSEPEVSFHDTSFFRHGHQALPTPATVLAASTNASASVVTFEDLNLVVKFGSLSSQSPVSLEEAQALRAIRRAFANEEIPVPEVFGWKRHGDQNFIYMSLIRGQTLREAWKALDTSDKKAICAQLKQIVTSLRSASHDMSGEIMIGGSAGFALFSLFTNSS